MNTEKRKIGSVLLSVILVCTMWGCRQKEKETDTGSQETAGISGAAHASVSTVALTEGKFSEEKLDDTWDEKEAVYVTLENDQISVKGAADSDYGEETALKEKVEATGSTAVIRQAGTYVLSGTLEDGQLIIDADKEETVRLIFRGISLSCSYSAPVYSKGGNVIVTLEEGKDNRIGDGGDDRSGKEEEPEAAVFSKDDLTFNGTGTLSVTGNYGHGIQCKDDLKFVSGTYTVSAVNDGIVGKDSVSVRDGSFTIESGDDGIRASNTEDSDKGYVLIENGSFQINAKGDGIQAETLLRVNDGNFEITAGGGSQNAEMVSDRLTPPAAREPEGTTPESGMMEGGEPPEGGRLKKGMEPPGAGNALEEGKVKPPEGDVPAEKMQPPEGEMSEEEMQPPEGDRPAEEGLEGEMPYESGDAASESDNGKALKSYVELIIAGGDFSLDSQDDGIHSNQNVTVEGGVITVSAGDDGIHADKTLTVEGGSIDIQKSYEGLEGFDIVINDGSIKIVSSDDGINAAGDDDSAAEPDAGDGHKGQTFMADEDQGASMTVNGGTVYVNANGDGLDANGDIFLNGGTVTVHGPADGGNGTLDYATSCRITGGTFTGTGSSGMAQNPSEDSTQVTVVFCMNTAVGAGTAVSLKDQAGNTLAETVTEKNAQWFALSSPELAVGETYLFCVGTTEKEVILTRTVTQFSL